MPHVLQLSEDGEAIFDARSHVEGGSIRGHGRWTNRSDGLRVEVLLWRFDIEGIPPASTVFGETAGDASGRASTAGMYLTTAFFQSTAFFTRPGVSLTDCACL